MFPLCINMTFFTLNKPCAVADPYIRKKDMNDALMTLFHFLKKTETTELAIQLLKVLCFIPSGILLKMIEEHQELVKPLTQEIHSYLEKVFNTTIHDACDFQRVCSFIQDDGFKKDIPTVILQLLWSEILLQVIKKEPTYNTALKDFEFLPSRLDMRNLSILRHPLTLEQEKIFNNLSKKISTLSKL